jgi:hypothetical protein
VGDCRGEMAAWERLKLDIPNDPNSRVNDKGLSLREAIIPLMKSGIEPKSDGQATLGW